MGTQDDLIIGPDEMSSEDDSDEMSPSMFNPAENK